MKNADRKEADRRGRQSCIKETDNQEGKIHIYRWKDRPSGTRKIQTINRKTEYQTEKRQTINEKAES